MTIERNSKEMKISQIDIINKLQEKSSINVSKGAQTAMEVNFQPNCESTIQGIDRKFIVQ